MGSDPNIYGIGPIMNKGLSLLTSVKSGNGTLLLDFKVSQAELMKVSS